MNINCVNLGTQNVSLLVQTKFYGTEVMSKIQKVEGKKVTTKNNFRDIFIEGNITDIFSSSKFLDLKRGISVIDLKILRIP